MTESSQPDGTRLRLARQARGLSQQQLAGVAGVTRQAVSAVESGHSDPSLRVALGLARALGMTVEELFGPGEPRRSGAGPADRPGQRPRLPGRAGHRGRYVRRAAAGRGPGRPARLRRRRRPDGPRRRSPRSPRGPRDPRDPRSPGNLRGPGRGAADRAAAAHRGGGRLRSGAAAARNAARAARPAAGVRLVAVRQRRGPAPGRGRPGARGRRAPRRPGRGRATHDRGIPGRRRGGRIRLLARGPGGPARSRGPRPGRRGQARDCGWSTASRERRRARCSTASASGSAWSPPS